MSTNVIRLDLKQREGASPDDMLRDLLDRTLVVLHDWVKLSSDPTTGQVTEEVECCRTQLQDGAHGEDLAPRLNGCLQNATSLLALFEEQQKKGRAEISTLIAIVQDAVEEVLVGTAKADAVLDHSADRFASVLHLHDIHQIKRAVEVEVGTLKRVLAERRAASETSMSLLNERVHLLERQLATSRQEASIDALTGIANRRRFDQTVREYMSPERHSFVVALVDLDGFKQINDTFGHAAGDRVLASVARILTGAVRATDLVARVGGDEFAIVMNALTLRQAEYRLKQVLAAVSSMLDRESNTQGISVTASAGAAEFSAGDTSASLLHRADEALYTAKHLGKNRVVTKSSPLINELLSRH